VFVDEPTIGPAVEGRKVRVEDEIPGHVLDSEFPHVLIEKHVEGELGLEDPRVLENRF
jgi:hypothetical protein